MAKKKYGTKAVKAQAEKETGQDAVRTVQLDIETMRLSGTLVDIDIHGQSMLLTRATWAELGIPEGDVRRKRLKRGNKDLFPGYTNQFNSLASRFRYTLDKYGRELEGFRPYRWVSYKRYAEFRREWDSLKAEWDELKAEFLERYDDFKAEYIAYLKVGAEEAWDALQARYKARNGGGEAVVMVNELTFETLDVFVEYVAAVADRMPSQEALERGLYVDYKTAMVLSGADVEADLAEAAHQRAEQALALERQRRAELAREQAEREAWKQKRFDEMEVETAEEERRIKLEAMHRAEIEHARQQLTQIVSPFQEAFEQLRAEIHQAVMDMSASVKKNGYVRGKVAERMRGLLEMFRLMDDVGDEDLEVALVELRSRLAERLAEGDKRYDTASVLGQLKAIADLTHEAAEEVARRADIATRAAALEL